MSTPHEQWPTPSAHNNRAANTPARPGETHDVSQGFTPPAAQSAPYGQQYSGAPYWAAGGSGYASPHGAPYGGTYGAPQNGPYGPPPSAPGGPTGSPAHRRWQTALVGVAALVIAAGAGVGVGHLVWPGSSAPTHTAATQPLDGSNPNSGNNNGGAVGGNGNGGSNGNDGSTGNGGGSVGLPPGLLMPGLVPQNLLPGNSPLNPGDGGSTENGSNSATNGSRITSAPGAPSNIAAITKKVDPAVVDINVGFQYQQAMGAGTGIVLTKNGEVLTNNHVIDGATSISVTDIGNGQTYPAKVVGFDPSDDVAVLQLKGASGLTTASLGDSASLKVDDAIVGIGNAAGLGGAPSAAGGSVTGLNKSISVGDEMYGTTAKLTGLIEVNADIQSGDSGGPLVTSNGKVVGMDTAASVGLAATDSGHDGYAIPIDKALAIASTIESGHGTNTIHVGPAAALGVLVSTHGAQSNATEPGTEQSPTRRGTSGNSGAATGSGAYVAGVIAGGAGAQAGLTPGDVITTLEGHTIGSAQDLSALLLEDHPGQSVTLGWTTPDGTAHHATVTLGTGPAA